MQMLKQKAILDKEERARKELLNSQMAKLNLDIYSYALPVIPADSEQPIQYG